MPSPNLKKALIIISLGYLTISAFFIRLENFNATSARSIDEMVYFYMAQQVVEDPSAYNTNAYGQRLAATGRELPEYFFKPLFKHPPVYTFSSALAMTLLNRTDILVSAYVTVFFGVLIIPLVYLMASFLFNRSAGILAAVWMYLDPIWMITSQKAWMDTTLAFWMVLSVYLFMRALKKNNPLLFLLSASAVGLAANTKYPGMLPIFAFFSYAVLYQKSLWKNSSFWLCLIAPWALLIPWFFWNISVYGWSFLTSQGDIHHDAARVASDLTHPGILLLGVLLLGVGVYFLKRLDLEKELDTPQAFFPPRRGIFLSLLLLSVFPSVITSFLPVLPRVSWQTAMFMGEPPVFYFGRLLEFSPLYLMAFAAFFTTFSPNRYAVLTKITIFVILLFFILWQNYQSRYILAALPLFIVLGSGLFLHLWQKARQLQTPIRRFLAVSGLTIWTIYAVEKTVFVNLMLSTPHNFCFY